jgi:anti-anti-sigma factor
MEMIIESLPDGITKVQLAGKMDLAGAQSIDMKFNVMSGSHRYVIIDLEKVSFLASMGIRTLIVGAKTIQAKGGRMVLLSPSEEVENVLIGSGITTMIPIAKDESTAIGLLKTVQQS